MLFSQLAKDWFLSYFIQSTGGTGKVQISGGAKNNNNKKKKKIGGGQLTPANKAL